MLKLCRIMNITVLCTWHPCKAISYLSDVHELQDYLERDIKWSNRNKMTLHEDLSTYVMVKTPRISFNLPFTSKSHLRDLGVMISDDLFLVKISKTILIYIICDKTRQMAASRVFSVFLTLGCPVSSQHEPQKYFSPFTSLLFDATWSTALHFGHYPK